MDEQGNDEFVRKLSEAAELINIKPKPFLVAIAGGSCAGKSYFAEKLAEEIEKQGICSSIVPLDDYFKDGNDESHPRDENGKLILDVPGSYDSAIFVDQVMKLMKGVCVESPCYDKKYCQRKVEKKIIHKAPVIIAEGLYAIRFLAGNFSNMLSVYLRSGESVRLQRRIARDVPAFGVSKEKVRDFFLNHVEFYFRGCNISQLKQANMVIDT